MLKITAIGNLTNDVELKVSETNRKGVRETSNQKYEITDIAHEKYPFLHRIRALRDIRPDIKAGDLGGFVESESNLSTELEDNAWIYDDAVVCNNGYADRGAVLRNEAIVCGDGYISHGAVVSGHSRVEDSAYVRGAVLNGHARASGCAVVRCSRESGHPRSSQATVQSTGTCLVMCG